MLDFQIILPDWLQWDQYLQVMMSYVNEFIKCNYISIGLLIGVLKWIAVKSKNNYDDKIITYLTNLFTKKKKSKLLGSSEVSDGNK